MPNKEAPDISNKRMRVSENAKLKPISNCYVFAKVMQDYPDICRRLITCILDEEIRRIEMQEAESTENTALAKSVHFDAYLRDKLVLVTMEMQSSFEYDLPLRNTYYQSWLAERALRRGEGLSNIPRQCVVFICTYDPLGKGKPVYRVVRQIRDTVGGEYPWEDVEECILLDTTAYLTCGMPSLATILKYVNTGGNDTENKLVADMEVARKRAHQDEEWVRNMNLADLDRKAWEKAAHEKGLAEGRASERTRQTALLATMKAAGCDTTEFVTAIEEDNLDALYQKYGIE